MLFSIPDKIDSAPLAQMTPSSPPLTHTPFTYPDSGGWQWEELLYIVAMILRFTWYLYKLRINIYLYFLFVSYKLDQYLLMDCRVHNVNYS